MNLAELYLVNAHLQPTLWRAVCIINNVDVSKYNFGPRQRGRGLVGVTDVDVVYTPSTMCVSSASNGSPSPLCVFHCLRGPVSVSLSVYSVSHGAASVS